MDVTKNQNTKDSDDYVLITKLKKKNEIVCTYGNKLTVDIS